MIVLFLVIIQKKISANINTQALGVKEEEEKGGERERGREETMVVKIVSECETPKVKEGSCTCYVVIVHDLDRKKISFFSLPFPFSYSLFLCV